MSFTLVPLSFLIANSFDIATTRIDGPGWLGEARYDIAANLPAGATREQVKQMMRQLLNDRFHLTFHIETKEAPVYFMTIAKEGAKLPESKPDSPDDPPPPRGLGKDGFPQVRPAFDGVPLMIRMRDRALIAVRDVSAREIAVLLSQELDRPVVDSTGLTGRYDVTLRYSPDNASDADPSGLPSLRNAVPAQLGLRLEARQGPVETLVIDHVEKIPVEN